MKIKSHEVHGTSALALADGHGLEGLRHRLERSSSFTGAR